MTEINRLRGTNYDLVTYYGAEAEEVIVTMGSVAQTIEQTVDYLQQQGRKVGFLNVHLYRPFPIETFLEKYLNQLKQLLSWIGRKSPVLVVNRYYWMSKVRCMSGHSPNTGRYGLGSQRCTAKSNCCGFDELMKERSAMKKRFTIGIDDDLTYTSLEVGKPLDFDESENHQAKFWALVLMGGANKSAIKIIGDHTDKYAQGFFYYDPKIRRVDRFSFTFWRDTHSFNVPSLNILILWPVIQPLICIPMI